MAIVHAEGRSLARIRRYQMAINKMWDEIEKTFYIYGRVDETWEAFQKNVNYNAFLATRKKYITLMEQPESYMSTKPENKEIKRVYNDRFDVEMRDYSNEPCFVERTKKAEESLKKSGLPKELMDRLGDQYGED